MSLKSEFLISDLCSFVSKKVNNQLYIIYYFLLFLVNISNEYQFFHQILLNFLFWSLLRYKYK